MLSVLQTLDGGALLWIQENLRGLLEPHRRGIYYTGQHRPDVDRALSSHAVLEAYPESGGGALAAMVLGLLCTNVVLKHVVARPRPWLDVAGLVPLIQEPDPNSFPSGHTCAAFAAASAWWRALPRRWMRWTGLVLAVCMGLSRLYVGGPLPQRCDRRGTGRPVLRLGGLEAAAAVGGAAGI